MANVALVGVVEETGTAGVATGSVWGSVTGDVHVDLISAGSVSTLDPSVGRKAAGNSAAAGAMTLAWPVEASVSGTSETVDGMIALSGIAALFSGKIPHARKPLLAVPGVAARPQASLSSDPN